MSIYVYKKNQNRIFYFSCKTSLFIIFFSFPLQGVRHQVHPHIFRVR